MLLASASHPLQHGRNLNTYNTILIVLTHNLKPKYNNKMITKFYPLSIDKWFYFINSAHKNMKKHFHIK